jgi:formylmethanofuran dehydrogenase subunit A
MRRALLVLAALLGLVSGSNAQESGSYDVVIRGGRVLDGTGNPFFHADVAIDDGRIVLIGNVSDAPAERTIDARGLYVAPGFIDMHSHAMNAFHDPVTIRNRTWLKIKCGHRQEFVVVGYTDPEGSRTGFVS